MHYKCSIILRSGNCGGHSRCFSSLWCSWYQFLTTWAVCFGALSPSPSGNNACTIRWNDLPKCSGNLCCWSYQAGQRWDRENSTIWLSKPSLIHLRAPLWEEGSQSCELPWSASAQTRPAVGERENRTRQKISLSTIGLQTNPCDLYTLQPLLNVASGKQRCPDGGSTPQIFFSFVKLQIIYFSFLDRLGP